MKMRKLHTAALLAAWLMLPGIGAAQFDEFGVFLGASTYGGDLTERLVEPLEINFAAGFYLRRRLNDHWGLKMNAYRGVISGDDAHATTESGLWMRNLSFRSEIYELGAALEFSPVRFRTDYYQGAPYLFSGISAFYFMPTAEMDGKTYNLHAYRTEGTEYSLFQFALPFGAGMRLDVNGNGSLGVELGFRKTFTDYLDDVSDTYAPAVVSGSDGARSLQSRLSYRSPEVLPGAAPAPHEGQVRGNPEHNDWFMFFGLTLGINLK